MLGSRIPPSWFESKLRAINRRLRVRWDDYKNMWIVEECVPWAVFSGRAGGNRLYHGKRNWMRVIFSQELGSRVLDYVRRVDMRRFSSLDQMERELDLDKTDSGGFSQKAIEAFT